MIDGDRRREWLAQVTNGQTNGGALAVHGFFAISGFLITRSWLRSSGIVSYLSKRVRRIYPGFIVASLVSILIAYSAATHRTTFLSWVHPSRDAMRTILLSQPKTPPAFSGNHFTDCNGALWTIRYEFTCYLAVMALGARRRPRLILALFAMAIAAHIVQEHAAPEALPSEFFFAFPFVWCRLGCYYLAGMAFEAWEARIPMRPWIAALAAVLVAAGVASGLGALVLPTAGTYLMFYAALGAPAIRLPWRADISYGMYLYGWPIQMLLTWHHPGISPLGLTLATVPIVAALATISFYLVERPFLSASRTSANRE